MYSFSEYFFVLDSYIEKKDKCIGEVNFYGITEKTFNSQEIMK